MLRAASARKTSGISICTPSGTTLRIFRPDQNDLDLSTGPTTSLDGLFSMTDSILRTLPVILNWTSFHETASVD